MLPGMKRRLFETPHHTAQLSGHLAGKPPAARHTAGPALRGSFAVPPSGSVTLSGLAPGAPARFAPLPTVTLPAQAPAATRKAALLSAVQGVAGAPGQHQQPTQQPKGKGAQLLAAVARFGGNWAGHDIGPNPDAGGKRPQTLEEADKATKHLKDRKAKKSPLIQAVEDLSQGK